MQTHLLFPIPVLETSYNNPLAIKHDLSSIITNYVDENGFSNELTGHVTMHHEPLLKPVFELATTAAKAFVANYKIDPDIFDFHVVKSWMNMIEHTDTPQHNHADASISFVYYVNIPNNNSTPITFCNYHNKHEPFPFISKVNPPSEWNMINSYGWSFTPKEGTLFVFPASVSHYVAQHDQINETGVHNADDFYRHRISIAGDMLLTYKETSAKSLGLQPIANWRTF